MANKYGIPADLGSGGVGLTDGTLRALLEATRARIAAAPTSLTSLKAIGPNDRGEGMFAVVTADRSQWQFDAASTLPGDDLLVVTPADNPTAGRWIRVDKHVDLKLPVGFGTANNAVLYTVPTGFKLQPGLAFWEPTADWTGGSSSAIGLSSSHPSASTAGDLLGGAGGDVAATLVASAGYAGTTGTKIATPTPGLILTGGQTIKFNRIVSAFTAGAGFAHVPVTRIG